MALRDNNMGRFLLALLLSATALDAAAQLSDRDHRGGRAAHADRHRPVPGRAECRHEPHGNRARGSGAQRPFPRARDPAARAASERELARQLRRMALAPRRCARRRVGGAEPRRPLRGALSRLRRGEAGANGRHRVPLHQGQRARRGAPHRRLRLREDHRREGCVLDPNRLRGEARPRPTSCRSPTPTASAPSICCAPTSRSSRRSGRPTAGASPTCRSSRRSRWCTCITCRRTSVRSSRASGARIPAPAWSPDGKTIAVVLSVEGGSQIYLISADGSGPRRRISNSASIDTEPRYSTDGKWIYFTSDRGGSPQIYRMPSTGGRAAARHLQGQL